eukprot:2677971-Alexandrium_andersonii.AAC.1
MPERARLPHQRRKSAPMSGPYLHSKAPPQGGHDARGRPTAQGRVEVDQHDAPWRRERGRMPHG